MSFFRRHYSRVRFRVFKNGITRPIRIKIIKDHPIQIAKYPPHDWCDRLKGTPRTLILDPHSLMRNVRSAKSSLKKTTPQPPCFKLQSNPFKESGSPKILRFTQDDAATNANGALAVCKSSARKNVTECAIRRGGGDEASPMRSRSCTTMTPRGARSTLAHHGLFSRKRHATPAG